MATKGSLKCPECGFFGPENSFMELGGDNFGPVCLCKRCFDRLFPGLRRQLKKIEQEIAESTG